MTKAQHTPSDGSRGAHDVFTQERQPGYQRRCITEVKTRHISAELRPDRGEHTQLEIRIDEIKGEKCRSYQTFGSLTLDPPEAEAMALSLLPPEERCLIAAAPELLAYAECSAAVDCSRADPQYDPQPVLLGHGWNGEENPGVFLSRIRRDALNKAVGHYLGRAAA